jgi:hypothetical protein
VKASPRAFGTGLAVAGGLAAAATGLAGCGGPEESFGLGTRRAGLVLGSVHWQQPLATLPPSRMGHALIYDSARGVTLAVGGRPVNDTGGSSADTWAWDGSVWTELPASFPPRGFIQGTFDSVRQVSVIYGGIDQSPASAYFAETLERSTGTWSNRSGTPGARGSSGLSFDAGRGVTVLFGGFDGTWRDDIWEWDGTAWTQRCTASPCNTAMPSRRSRRCCSAASTPATATSISATRGRGTAASGRATPRPPRRALASARRPRTIR